MRLYRLYLGRGLAGLTRSLAQPEQAKLDLFAASFIRTGAFLPKVMFALCNLAPDNPQAAIDEVEALAKNGPPQAQQVVGALLHAFSGVQRPAGCNLMDFALPYASRRVLFEAAQRLLADAPPEIAAAAEPWTGLEREIAGHAQRAATVFGQSFAVGEHIDAGLALLREEVHDGAPLQSWQLTFALLSDPLALMPPRTEARQVAAWLNVLQLQPRALSESAGERIDQLVARVPEEPRAQELAARVALLRRDPKALARAATRWFELEPDAPGPLLCHFEASVLAEDLPEAGIRGVELLQNAIDPARVRARLDAALAAAEAAPGPQVTAARWADLRQKFAGFGH